MKNIVALVLVASAVTNAWAQRPANDHVSNRLVVQRRNGASVTAASQAVAANGASVVAQIPAINVMVLQLPEQAADRVAAALQRSGHFSFVERDFVASANSTPDDPYFTS